MGGIVFLGVDGSGKTSLAMAFLAAVKRHRNEGWYLAPKSKDAFAFTNMMPDDFSLEGFPHETASVKRLVWDLEYKGKVVQELVFFDYPGEMLRQAFLDGRLDMDENQFTERVSAESAEISQLLKTVDEAEHVFVLLNMSDAIDLKHNTKNIDAVWATNECLKFIKKVPGHPKHTLLFSQVDKYGDADRLEKCFKLEDVDLIAHDNPNVAWQSVSVLVPSDSKVGVDNVVAIAVCDNLKDVCKEELEAIEKEIASKPIAEITRRLFDFCSEDEYSLSVSDQGFSELERLLSAREKMRGMAPWMFERLVVFSTDEARILNEQEIQSVRRCCDELRNFVVKGKTDEDYYPSILKRIDAAISAKAADDAAVWFLSEVRQGISTLKDDCLKSWKSRVAAIRESWGMSCGSLLRNRPGIKTMDELCAFIDSARFANEDLIETRSNVVKIFGNDEDFSLGNVSETDFVNDIVAKLDDKILESSELSIRSLLEDFLKGLSEDFRANDIYAYLQRSLEELRSRRGCIWSFVVLCTFVVAGTLGVLIVSADHYFGGAEKKSLLDLGERLRKTNFESAQRSVTPSVTNAVSTAPLSATTLHSQPKSIKDAMTLLRVNTYLRGMKNGFQVRIKNEHSGEVSRRGDVQWLCCPGERIGPFDVWCKEDNKYYHKRFAVIEVTWKGLKKLSFPLDENNRCAESAVKEEWIDFL